METTSVTDATVCRRNALLFAVFSREGLNGEKTRPLTRLDLRALLLVGEKLAQFSLVLIVELIHVEILNAHRRRLH